MIKASAVKELLEIIHRRKVESSPGLTQLYSDLKRRHPMEVDIEGLCSWVNDTITIVTPIIILLIKLRRRIISEAFWQKKITARQQHQVQGQIDYIFKLQGIVKDISNQRKLRIKQEKLKSSCNNSDPHQSFTEESSLSVRDGTIRVKSSGKIKRLTTCSSRSLDAPSGRKVPNITSSSRSPDAPSGRKVPNIEIPLPNKQDKTNASTKILHSPVIRSTRIRSEFTTKSGRQAESEKVRDEDGNSARPSSKQSARKKSDERKC